MSLNISSQVLIDGLGHAVLVFSSDNKLAQHNLMAGTLLGSDLHLIRTEGWSAAVQLFNTELDNPENTLDSIRKRAMTSERPLRFHTLRNGEYLPCWMSAVASDDGVIFTLILIDVPDWHVVGSVVQRFNQEMRETIESTVGHINLINKTLYARDDDETTARIARRLGGFSKLIAMHMKRAHRLMGMIERLEDLRTGQTRTHAQENRGPIGFADFMEDFLESLDEIELLDPETENHDFRARIAVSMPPGLTLHAHKRYVTFVLQELLRNAIMYSLRGTPIRINAAVRGNFAQIDVIDEGYGIREKDYDRVFSLFQRGRQPQIISEFGYGLALYLCKSEVLAMNGKLWFTAVENVSTTFSLLLPLYVEASSSSSKSA